MSDTKGEEVVDRNDIDLNIKEDKCPSKNKEPTPLTNEEDFNKQASIFFPDNNPECKEDATTKMANLNNLYKEFKNETNPNAANQNAANPKATDTSPNTTDVNSKDAANTNADAANTNADAAITTTTAATTTADNTVYAIIQINADKITVLDNADGQTLNTTDSPYDLLVKKTPSVFAVKIVKKDKDKCKPTDKIICIDFDNSHYEMDLTTVVSDVPTLRLNQEFLTGSAEVVEGAKDDAEGDGKDADKVAEGAEGKDADNNNQILDSHDSRKYKKGDTVKYNGINLTITGIGENTESQLSYFTDKGSRNGDDVDKTGELVNSGGSRKKRTQKSKKTKRKYYVYRK